jgi:hypothetical protein
MLRFAALQKNAAATQLMAKDFHLPSAFWFSQSFTASPHLTHAGRTRLFSLQARAADLCRASASR